LDDGETLIKFGLGQGILGREKLLLGFEDFVVAGRADGIALGRDGNGFLVGGDGAGLFETDLFEAVDAR